MNNSREAFEKWWPSVGQTIGKVAAWEAWQAAQQHSGEPVVPEGYVLVPIHALGEWFMEGKGGEPT